MIRAHRQVLAHFDSFVNSVAMVEICIHWSTICNKLHIGAQNNMIATTISLSIKINQLHRNIICNDQLVTYKKQINIYNSRLKLLPYLLLQQANTVTQPLLKHQHKNAENQRCSLLNHDEIIFSLTQTLKDDTSRLVKSMTIPSFHTFLSLLSYGQSKPSHCPVRASVLLMTMSISVAPSATAIRTSCRRVSRGVWPAGKPVATGGGGKTYCP